MSQDSDSHEAVANGEDDHPTDEEQVETEWHIWLVAILAAGGIALIVFPPDILPEAGFVLLGVAVAGWVFKTVIEDKL